MTDPDLEGTTLVYLDCSANSALQRFSQDSQYPIGILTLMISTLGVVFNIINIIVLTNVKMRTPVNLLLTLLSIAELLLIMIYIPYLLIFDLFVPSGIRYTTTDKTLAYYLLFYADASVFLHLSVIWLTITTACFRFLLVQLPMAAVKLCTYKRAILAAILTFTVSLLLTLPNIFQNEIGPINHTCYVEAENETWQQYYGITLSESFVQSQWAIRLNYWLFAALGKFLPCILLLVFTMFLVKVLHKAEIRQQRLHNNTRRFSRDSSTKGILRKRSKSSSSKKSSTSDRANDYHQTTRMLLAVVISFTAVELPHGILLLWVMLTSNHVVYSLLGDVIDLATLTSFSINFVLYSIMSRQYRQLFMALLCKPFSCEKSHKCGQSKFLRNRSNCRTMHTECSEFHPLNKRSPKNAKEIDSPNNDAAAKNGKVDV